MRTKNLVMLKKLVFGLYIGNIAAYIFCVLCQFVSTVGYSDFSNTITFFSIAVINAISIELMSKLHDAAVDEINDRRQKNERNREN